MTLNSKKGNVVNVQQDKLHFQAGCKEFAKVKRFLLLPIENVNAVE
jgi:hypothetical protein